MKPEGLFKTITQSHHFLEGLTSCCWLQIANIGNPDVAHKALNDPALVATSPAPAPPVSSAPPCLAPPTSFRPSSAFCQPGSPTLLAPWFFIHFVSAEMSLPPRPSLTCPLRQLSPWTPAPCLPLQQCMCIHCICLLICLLCLFSLSVSRNSRGRNPRWPCSIPRSSNFLANRGCSGCCLINE